MLDGSGLHWLLLPYAARNCVDFSLDLNEPRVLIEQRLGFNQFQTEGTETGKACDAKVEVTAGLWNWRVEDDCSCLAGWSFRRIFCKYEGSIECLAMKAKSPILKWIRHPVGNQWREWVITEALSDKEALTTVLASRLWKQCNLSGLHSEVPEADYYNNPVWKPVQYRRYVMMTRITCPTVRTKKHKPPWLVCPALLEFRNKIAF